MQTTDPTDPGNLTVPDGFVADLMAAGFFTVGLTCFGQDRSDNFAWVATAFRKLADGEPNPVEGDGVNLSTAGGYRSVHLTGYGPTPSAAIGRLLDLARSFPAPTAEAVAP